MYSRVSITLWTKKPRVLFALNVLNFPFQSISRRLVHDTIQISQPHNVLGLSSVQNIKSVHLGHSLFHLQRGDIVMTEFIVSALTSALLHGVTVDLKGQHTECLAIHILNSDMKHASHRGPHPRFVEHTQSSRLQIDGNVKATEWFMGLSGSARTRCDVIMFVIELFECFIALESLCKMICKICPIMHPRIERNLSHLICKFGVPAMGLFRSTIFPH